MACAACPVILRGRQKENPPNASLRDKEGQTGKAGPVMRYLVRLVVILALLAAIAVVAFAYFGDMGVVQQRQDVPVTLPQN
jgi:hypothetical protein